MTWLAVVAAIVAFDLLTAVLIRVFIGRSWQPLVERYPARDPSPDAVHRRFQSFRLGFINLGWSMHVAADDAYLHLIPTKFAGLVGCSAVSIPWDAIEVVRHSANGRQATARLGVGLLLEGPAWCLDLAGDEVTDHSRIGS